MRHAPYVLLAATFLAACGSGDDNGAGTASAPLNCSVSETASLDNLTESVAAVYDEGKTSNRFVVKLSANGSATTEERTIAKADFFSMASAAGAVTEPLTDEHMLLKFPSAVTTAEAAAQLSPDTYDYIEPDEIVHHTAVSNDPSVGNQWAHAKVGSTGAWAVSAGSRSVVVAVVDSGVDYTHPDLSANMWRNPGEVADNGKDDDGNGFVDDVYGWDFRNDDNKPMADDASGYHGTHVAGTIGAVGNNGVGISGHAQQVQIMALKFLGSAGSGYRSDAIKAIDYAIKMKAKIISNSWGGTTFSQALYDAITRAKNAGILFVAAAGNSGQNADSSNHYPSNYPHDNVISVASSTSSDGLSSFSNYGKENIDIAAPGSSIYSTKNGSAYQYLSGTSMATPLVSGVLATMIAKRPDLNYRQLKDILMSTVDTKSAFSGKVKSNGRINAAKALTLTASYGNSTVPPEDPTDPTPSDPTPPSMGCP